MRNKRKYKAQILQQIRLLASIKDKRRQKRRTRNQKQGVEIVQIPRIPRKMRRTKFSNNSFSASQKDISILQKKSELVQKYLPENLKYITETEDSPFNLKSIRKEKYKTNGTVCIPENFSVLDNPDESYPALRQLIAALLLEQNDKVVLNYEKCKNIELSTQVLLDIILMDFVKLQIKCKSINRQKQNLFPLIGHINLVDKKLQKLIYSVGSPVNLRVQQINFSDTVKYKLRVHNNRIDKDVNKRMAQKELDTTEMADYVIACLAKMHKELGHKKLDDLCTVIGEVLINAEEHSTTQHRFSIGYFKEENESGNHYGLFRLVILNFGKTIYEKFKSDDCPNQDIVMRMNGLSESYTKKSWLKKGEFEEESLWTLYALQEGVTSISQESYKRGNGSIRFIESFFNIKGSNEVDDISKMSIVSGRTRIVFNGKYCISTTTKSNGEQFKVMTFNDSGNIEDKPDNECVRYSKNYFPGTMISAKILLNDDDIRQI
jgi:hypothetical protein